MSFFINMGASTPPQAPKAANYPRSVSNEILCLHTDNLKAIAQALAEPALLYEDSFLLKSCLKSWQEKNQTPLPSDALSHLTAEARAHTKEAAKYIYLDLIRILYGKNTLNMYGYVHFAALNLKRYYQSLTNRLLRVLKQKEDDEAFVQALRLLVKVQIPQIKKAEVFLHADGTFEIYDENERDLKKAYLTENDPAQWQDAQPEDRLMSILLTFSPAEILLYAPQYTDCVPLIREVFQERLKIEN